MTSNEFTLQELFIDVGSGHQLYVQDWGYPKAQTPIIFLHGGPGGSVEDRHRNNFNPFEQRVIFFDQRGSGRSLPYGSIENNTTTDLIEDIDKIAQHLSLGQILLTGDSWGACLALAYGLKYPKRVSGMVLQGVFTASQSEIDYLDKGGFKTFFPDVWEQYLNQTPKAHHDSPSNYHFSRILSDNLEAARESALIYSNLESSLLRLDDRFTAQDPSEFDPAAIRIEVLYLTNLCFLPDRYILDNVHKLTMPIWIVQGRYDFVCPPYISYELHKKAQNSTLLWTVAGHSSNDRSNYDVLRTIYANL